MRQKDTSRQGIAAVEFALLLPVMMLMLFLLVEGANAMHAYSSLVAASREGARLALMDASSADIEALVESVTDELDTASLNTSVTAGANTVTVEVAYDYQPFSENALKLFMDEESLLLVAQTTMPLP